MPFPPPRMTTKAPTERHFACFGLCPMRFSCVAAPRVAVRRRPSGNAGHAGEAWWTGLPGLTINRRSLAPAPGSAQVAQLVEHATENRSVGGSIPPLGTISSNEFIMIDDSSFRLILSGAVRGVIL